MKFVRAVEQLETGASRSAALKKQRAVAWGLIWADHDAEPIDQGELGPGETVALDLMVLEEINGVRVCKAVERIATDPADVGWVLDAEGELTGRVLALEGSVVSVSWGSAASGA